MTGLVKEDFISRMRELGIQIQNGKIKFQFSLLNPGELLNQSGEFEYFDIKGEKQSIALQKGQLGFTFCQVPVLYSVSNEDKICVTFSDGKKIFIIGHVINIELSTNIFQRSGDIVQIEVFFRAFAS